MGIPSNNKAILADSMPAMVKHAGVWEGTYRHVDTNGTEIDYHDARIVCEFPSSGDIAYVQHNLFRWADGQEQRAMLPGVYRDGKLWWDMPTFHGYAWETEDEILMLNLTRRDEPGANFVEIIVMGDIGDRRSRTWHWFKNGALYKRTLCEESRVSTAVHPDDPAFTPGTGLHA
ncbi:hypothetical protein [Parasphingopyxis sp. CP4]|uniref:hypothetical protein n=1 Tax=Parasphingopyxis sp. CP4 TaxID=2724527 RepID=UPI0021029EEA|nr:hypothetical protein [Parasphingopyxis sp. CP4]